ncbi:MAG: DUF4249 family protein [Niastella sp.]|nr:DUF4249 family protein [Niastella sp.]
MTKQYSYPILFLLSLMITCLFSCTKEKASVPAPLPVVEGYLSPGKPASITINQEIQYGNTDTIIPITGLWAEIAHGAQRYVLTETRPGYYESSLLPVIAGDTYKLSFDYNGQEVSATTTIPLSPGTVTASGPELVVPQIGPGMQLPAPIEYTWENPEQYYHLMVVKNMEPNPQVITFNIGGNIIEKPAPMFRVPPLRGDQQQLSLGRFSYYGRHAIILYRIQPEYAALYEDNSNNSTNLVTPPTNITNGLGIFTGVHAADTLWLQVR